MPVKNNLPNNVIDLMHNIGALAVDPSSPNYVYCGTGHAYHAGDSFPGVGLFQSEDYGRSWIFLADADVHKIPHRISTIAVDPGNSNHIRIGGVDVTLAIDPDNPKASFQHPGMFFSTDRGMTWKGDTFRLHPGFVKKRGLSTNQAKALFKNREYQCHSIVWRKTDQGGVIFAAISGVLDWSGIWHGEYIGGDVGWQQLTRGLPPGREFGRTSLAISPADPKVIYAFVGSPDGRCLGVFRSKDDGQHWGSPAGPDYFAACGNLNYTNCIAVNPENPDLVVCGADDLHRSTDCGQTWTQVTEWFADKKSPGYAHKDHQTLLWPAKDCLYSGNDGGVDMSSDEGITWENLSPGLAITMFYEIDVAQSFRRPLPPQHAEAAESTTPAAGPVREAFDAAQAVRSAPDEAGLIIGGGTQDNASVMVRVEAPGIGYVPTERGLQASPQPGTPVGTINSSLVKPRLLKPSPTGSPAMLDFAEMLYGDGGWIVFDPDDPLHLYGSSQYMEIYRHRKTDGWVTVTPANASDEEKAKVWMAYIAMHRKHAEIVFTGSTRVWRTQNDGDDWTPISDDLDGSAISAIEISDKDPKFVYVGTDNGNIFKSADGGNRWSQDDGDDTAKPLDWRKDLRERPTVAVKRTITRIEANPDNACEVVVTLLGFDADARYEPGVTTPVCYPHVIWFDGQTWKDADPKPCLPNVHHNVVTWGGTNRVFVGNDVGVWVSVDLKSEEWFNISANLPNAIVTDLVCHGGTGTLVAATYGRSIWRLTKEKLEDLISKAQAQSKATNLPGSAPAPSS